MKKLCKDCKAVAACKYTFGRFWDGKSSGGVGCNCPIDEDRAKRIEAVLFTVRPNVEHQMEMELK